MAGNFCLPRRSASLITLSLLFFGLFCAEHSSEERLENLVLSLNLSLLLSWRHFWMKNLKMRNDTLEEFIRIFESEVFRKFLCSRY